MSILTESELNQFGSQSRKHFSTIGLGLESLKESRSLSKTSIFLSHKHSDKEQLYSAIQFLKQLGVNVYVDWLDEDMPKKTSGETAKKIKNKIKENDKFILLATESAIDSKWCNWELGLGDADKYIDHIALLPVRKSYTQNFSGSEYLQIYPAIEYLNGITKNTEDQYIPKGYYVLYPEDDQGNRMYQTLQDWLMK